MKKYVLATAAGLGLALMVGLVSTTAARPPAKPAEGATCNGDFGTSILFEDSPKEAAARALKEEKLVMVLHISGHFEDPKLTWNNAEALRVNALANPEVGKYVNEYFCCAYQKVGTFKVVGNQKQGGNVATYFCAPDGRVLHVVAGPVNAATLLHEAKWVVETTKKAMADCKGDGGKFKAIFRTLHAERLRNEHGLVVEAVTVDIAPQDPNSALTYSDPTGRPIAPKLPPPPIDGPDVKLLELQNNYRQAGAAKNLGLAEVRDGKGRAWVLGNQGRVHMLLAAYSMTKIEKVYGTVFENILGEKVSTRPVEVIKPFSWRGEGKNLEVRQQLQLKN